LYLAKQGYTQSHYRESENVKPIFLKDEDVFGSRKPKRSLWLTNVEIYKAIGDKVLPIFNILGIGLLNSLLITNLSPVSQLVSFPSTLSLSLNIPR
jgi:hypothetical protein